MAVPYESRGDSVRVVFYDLGDPTRPQRLGSIATPAGLGELTHASLAALARLDDGRWLLVVGGPSAKRLLFLRSRDTVLAPGDLVFDAIGTQLEGLVGGMQALSLVPQCDGRLFAVGFHNTAFPPPSMGRDHVHWYELTVVEPGVPWLAERGERHVDCDRCNLGGGAGAFVAADGTLVLYALGLTAAGPDDTVPLAELAPAALE